ncbi:hypothetical protein [Corynebacterium sp. AOP12-C2-36]|uniref:hypothetical protein n=1 Tax=Corynebacterium sp. AOP12-C2-36 TaxID=3457723 RepID=UPI004034AD3E
MTTTPPQTRQGRLRRYAASLAAAGLLSTPLLLATTGSAAAETPAERCQRQTAEYNTAMDTAWRAAHPGQQPTGNEWPPFVCREIPTPTPPPGGGNGGSQPAPERTHQYEGFDRPDSEYQQDMDLGGLGEPRTGLAERMGTGEPTDTTRPSAGDTARSNVPQVIPWNTTVTDDNGNTRDVRVVDTPDGPAVITDNGTATGEILTADTATGATSVTRQDGLEGRQLTDPTNSNDGRADGTGRNDTDDTSSATSTSAAVPAPGVDDTASTADEASSGDGDDDSGLPVGPLGAGGALAGAAGAILADRRRRDGAHRGDINWGNGREQSLILLEGVNSPREHRFDMDVPAGGQMVKNPDGSVDVLDADGNVVEHVKAPWAYDALGRPVETYYEVDNETGELVQVVDPDRTSVLPILADPDKQNTNIAKKKSVINNLPNDGIENIETENLEFRSYDTGLLPADPDLGLEESPYNTKEDPQGNGTVNVLASRRAISANFNRLGEPQANKALDHYFENTGETYFLEPSVVDSWMTDETNNYNDNSVAPGVIAKQDREVAIRNAKAEYEKTGKPVKYTYAGPWRTAAGSQGDHVHTLGHYQFTTTTTVRVSEPTEAGGEPRIEWQQTGHLLDVYDYKPGAETGLAQGASNMMAAAAEYGVAKPYIIAGDSNVISGRE